MFSVLQGTPLGHLCTQLHVLGIEPPAPEAEDVQRRVKRLKDEELKQEQARRHQIEVALGRLQSEPAGKPAGRPARPGRGPAPKGNGRRPSLGPRQASQAEVHKRGKPKQGAKETVEADRRAVRDLDQFTPSSPGAGIKAPAIESQAAAKARDEIAQIQKRLDALHNLQHQLEDMDHAVETIYLRRNQQVPMQSSKQANDDIPVKSAKAAVLEKKEALRKQEEQEQLARLEAARKASIEENRQAQERLHKQYHCSDLNVEHTVSELDENTGGEHQAEDIQHQAEALEQEYRSQLMASTTRIQQLEAELSDEEELCEDTLPEDVSEESSSDEDEDSPLMSGALEERIQMLRNRCTDALSTPVFLDVYGYIKHMRDTHDAVIDEQVEQEMEDHLMDMVGLEQMGYVKLVEQLMFIEECYA